MREQSAKEPGRRRLLFGAVLALALTLTLPATSGATMPGLNGRIAFQKATELSPSRFETQLWSMNPDGSGVTQLTSGKESAEPSYSPDGSRLAFGRYNEVWVAAADGSGAHAISVGSEHETETTRWVANYENPETHAVYPWVKVDEQREERDNLAEPAFSPLGSALAVAHYTATSVTEYICTVNADHDTSCNGTYSEFEFDCEDCGSSIEAIDATTGAPLATLVARTSGVYLGSPAYSHGGALAWTREPGDGSDPEIRSLPAPGAATVTVARGQVREPDFSPDGARLAYTSGRHDIGIVPAAGGTPTIISAAPPIPADDAWSARSPIWSPDGSLIAFGDIGGSSSGALDRFTDGGVYLMHPDGSNMTLIQGAASTPGSWQPLPVPPPPAPSIRARAAKAKKKLKLNKKGIAVLTKVTCGSSPCTLKATKPKLKIGKKRYAIKALVPKSLGAGGTAQLKIKVKGKALTALKAKHQGRLALTLTLSDITGPQSLVFKPKVVPAARHRKKH
jgi:Tol biopolymer transport system component